MINIKENQFCFINIFSSTGKKITYEKLRKYSNTKYILYLFLKVTGQHLIKFQFFFQKEISH